MEKNSAPIIGISRHRILKDGDGVTTLVGLKGCPLECKYCINKDILQSKSTPKYFTPQELIEVVKKDDIYFKATEGGIVFGGGEPLLHINFIREFRKIIPDKWKIIVETSLNVDSFLLLASVGVVDEYIIDIKDWNEDIYYAYTRGNNLSVKSNLKMLAEKKCPDSVTIKIPYIPGYNSVEDMSSSEKAIRTLGFNKIRKFKYHISRANESNPKTVSGKQVCNVLKYVRKTIANANDIDFSEEPCKTTTCSHGTCPKCDMYLLQLTNKVYNLSNPIL